MKNESKTRYAVLGALSLKPMSGYEIKKMMENSTNYFWSESNGQLYPTLRKLTKEKLIDCEEKVKDGRDKKIYRLNKAGLKLLKQWLLETPELSPSRNELLLKLFYGKNVDKSISIKHLENHLKDCNAYLSIFKNIEKNLLERLENDKETVFFLVTVKSGIKLVNASMEWCREAINLIETNS